MTELHDGIYNQCLYTEQINNILTSIRYFLVSIFCVCLCIYSIFHIFYGYSFLLSTWFNCTELIILFFLGVSSFKFQSNQYSYLEANIWIMFICFFTGFTIAIGSSLLYLHLPNTLAYLPFYQSLSLSALLIILSLVFALTFLAQKINYFLLFFSPIVIPFIYTQLVLLVDQQRLFFLVVDFLIVAILICAYISIRVNKKLFTINQKNKMLVKNAKHQLLIQDHLNKQLQYEMQKTKLIKQELKNHMQSLEDKIQERTLNLESAHQALKNKQTNLMLAHDIAGLTPWDWNIKDRIFTLTDKSNSSDYHNINRITVKNIHPDDVKIFKIEVRKHLRGLSDQFEVTYRIKHNNGTWHWIHDVGRVISRNPKNNFPLHMVGIRRDINKERLNQEQLILSASVLQQATEGIFILDEDFRYIDANPFYEKLTGFERSQIIGKHIFDIAANYKANQRSMHNSIITEILINGKYDNEIIEKFLSGNKLTIRIHINAIKNDHDKTMNYIGIVSDLTEKRLQEQRLSYLENYDALTDLPNRFYYNYQLYQYLTTHHDSIKELAIIRLNIDGFRHLNEYLTPSGGDELLKQLAQRLRMSNTEALFLAHLNADNFAIVYELSHIQPPIEQICERINHVFATPFNINHEEHIITISMGVSFYPEHGQHVDYLNHYAEQALSEAKRLGGNTTCYYNVEEHHVLIDEHVHLERELRQAIKNEELVVYYQPKLYFESLKIQGFEALIRWQHPSKGLIPPNLFIPIAEKTSLISEIGDFVIKQAAQQIKKWLNLGYEDITVSLNIVAQQLHRGHLLETIDRALDEFQISGKNIELEITESSLLDKSDLVKKTLNEIKNRNIHISLDDFGTGYSSLSYLTDFPIDTLKIDRSFISKIGNQQQEAVISAMVAMGKAMGMVIVAEGVETKQQNEYLLNLNCDLVQGFLFSKPLPEKEATEFLQENLKRDMSH